MRHRLFVSMGSCLAIAFALTAMPVTAQKKEKKDRVEGNVQSIDQATKTVTVTLRGEGKMYRSSSATRRRSPFEIKPAPSPN